MFICVSCGNKYYYKTGDVKEKTCYNCLSEYEENDSICREEYKRQKDEGII